MNAPDRQVLIEQLHAHVKKHDIRPDPDFGTRASGVYAVLDCVFSSMADFRTVVEPTLKRFGERSGMQDEPSLEFCCFIRDVDAHIAASGTFETYAHEIMGNRQKIAGRTKLEISYDVCKFFVERGHETMATLRALPQGRPGNCEVLRGPPGPLEKWVLEEMIQQGKHKIGGMGSALGAYLLMNLGNEEYVKVDTMIHRVFANLGTWVPRGSHPADDALISDVITCVARREGTSPARLDNALWKRESDLARNPTSPSQKEQTRGGELT